MIKSYCKLRDGGVKLLEFGAGAEFNYVRGDGVYRAGIRRQLKDSVEIVVEGGDKLSELKITNQGLLTWDDHWVDGNGVITDPGIEKLLLSRNSLVYCNINTPRPSLKYLDVRDNPGLQVLHLHECPGIEYINVSGCTGLKSIALGVNSRVQNLIAKDCDMSPGAIEQLLRDFTPVITSSANVSGAGVFRLQHNTLLDLRGNQIDWSNRRIASKIRLLLTNNWVVKWSNNPPTSIIPAQLYARFVESRIERSGFS